MLMKDGRKTQKSLRENDFTQGSIAKNIMSLAVPMTLAQLINILYNVVDRMYIGHMEGTGTQALTGLGLAFPVISIVTAFANWFGMGGAPLCSMARGEGDGERAERIMGNSFMLLLVSGIFLMVFFGLLKRPILYLFGASDVTYPFAASYLSIYLIGTVFVMISLGMNGFINSQGFGKIGMSTVLVGAVTNMALDPVFIFGFHMGVKGAAIATVIAQMVSAVWVLRFLTSSRAILRLYLKNMKLQAAIVRKVMALGLSGFAMAVNQSLVQIVCNTTLKAYGGSAGDLYIASMTVLNSVREILTMPVNGLTNGAQPVMGYNYGAQAYGRVRECFRFTTWVCIGITIFSWGLVRLFPGFFIHIFNGDAELMEVGIPAIRVYFAGFCFMALQFAGQSSFVALGKSKQAVFFSMFRKVIIVVPLTLLLPGISGIGVMGVFLAEPISNILGGTACFLTFYGTVYRKLAQNQHASD